jgi:acetoin:2,6-dichlorophenolindophenol oxidoreductase subunit alpha
MLKIAQRTAVELYRTMQRIRLCEEALVEPIVTGEVRCPVHLYTGEEAAAAGVCLALQREDYVFGTHRSHGHFLAKGGLMRELVAEVFCRSTGCSKGRGGSMHLYAPGSGMLGSAPIVAGTISLALGAALAANIRGEKRVTVSFFGDGAAGEGVLYESLNFAALKKLPIIFACENNFYSTHLPISECRPCDDFSAIGAAFTVETLQADGNDAIDVYQTARAAVARCRSGKGPVFIELKTYRMRGHVGPDDNVQGSHIDIRPKAEIERWRRKDPLKRLRAALREGNAVSERTLAAIDDAARHEVEDALAFARSSPCPDAADVGDFVYAR